MGLPTSSVLTISESIFDLIEAISIYLLFKILKIEVRDLLWPTCICLSLVLNTNFLLFLLIA